MSESNTPEISPYSGVDDAKALDNRDLAEAIIQQLGYDNSPDDDLFWQTSWSSFTLGKDFTLTSELYEAVLIYELKVTSANEKSEYIYFDENYSRLSFAEGEEGYAVIYTAEEEPEACRQIEKELRQYLRTAAIDYNKLPRNLIWDLLFEDLVVGLVTEDAVVANYFKDQRFFSHRRGTKDNLRRYLQDHFGLTPYGIDRVFEQFEPTEGIEDRHASQA